MPSPTHPSASAAPPNSKTDKGNATGIAKDADDSALPLNRYVIFFCIATVGLIADLWTKHVMFAWKGLPPGWVDPPRPHTTWWVPGCENLFGVETALNQGALFGIGQGKVWLFATLSFVAAGGILYWLFVAKAARERFLTFTLGLVMAGILGNLYDRLGLWGGTSPDGQTIYAVRDWILVAYGGLDLPVLGKRWPNFNIADSLLVCGAGLLIWHSIFTSDAEDEEEETEKSKA